MTRRFLPLGILAISTLVLAFLVQDFVRQVIVVPVLYLGWFVWLILENLPQWTFWALLTMIGLLLAIQSLSGWKRKEVQPPASALAVRGPVDRWAQRLNQASSQRSLQTTSKWRLSRDLGRYFWETHFPEESYNVQHYIARLSADETTLPGNIRDYFLAGTQRPEPVRSFLFFHRQSPPPPALDLDPEVVVAFLEDQLSPENDPAEISNIDHNQPE